MSQKTLVGRATTQKTPKSLLALFAERRVIAQGMIDEANEVLIDSSYSPMAKREAREQRYNGIRMQAMYA